MEVWERREELGVDVVGVSFAPPEAIERYREGLGLDVPIESDPERERYHALGFGRGSVRRVWLDPRVWLRYASLLRRGERKRVSLSGPRKLGPSSDVTSEDTLQLGGDALVDDDGRVVWVHRSRGPDDRPAFEVLAGAVAERLALS